ncbi:hypothetical protein IPM62_02870 [Candidatus Woesebacteria bacterium]|nr:MAG: hypothetical protein IPM62_02870 [Candidatus Woesebacteria bacterium]
MANEKLIGYALLVIGLTIIGYAVFNVLGLFTQNTQPVQMFDLPGLEIDLGQSYKVEIPQELTDAGVSVDMPTSKKQEILPAGIMNQTTNFIAQLVIMGFIVNVGYKIASVGIQLLRPIIVNNMAGVVSGSKETHSH